MSKLLKITPIIPVENVSKSADFFEKTLGFTSILEGSNTAVVKRDNVSLRLIPAGDNVGQLSCYILVEGIDELYSELKDELDKLPAGRFRAPFDREYSMREFHVIDLDSLLIFFGEPIKSH